MADVEAGAPTAWDHAWREGHAHGLEHALGIPYREAYQRTMAMLRGQPLDTTSVQAQNPAGQWVPAIPLPLFAWPHRHRCECGRSFWTMGGYRGHYALVHVMGLDTASPRAPAGEGLMSGDTAVCQLCADRLAGMVAGIDLEKQDP